MKCTAKTEAMILSTVAPVLAHARTQPRAPALEDSLTALSYGELAAAIETAAQALRGQGVEAGARIMVVGENSVALAVLLLAASRLGVCVVLENARRATPELQAIAAHCMPSHVYFVFAQSPDAQSHARAFEAREQDSPVLGRHAVVHGAAASSAVAPEGIEIMPPDVAAIIYTTGTTGQPKGVMLTHGNLSFIAGSMQTLRDMKPRDRIYAVLPITHVMGHASVFLGALHAGASLYLASRFSPAACVDVLRRRRITCLQGAPAMFAKLAEHCAAESISGFPDMRFIGSGGAPIDPAIKRAAEALFGCTLQNGYGLTEAASICWTRMDEALDDDSVGRPLPGVEISLRAPDGSEVAPGEVGTVWARGPNLMRGYFRNPEQTRKVMDADGWFNTEDLGRQEADGRLFIVGRTKEVIIRSGFKVYPLEVESALNAHPAVLHAAVVGRAIEGNEEVLAYVELRKGAQADADALQRHLAALLSPYKRPSRIVIADALPLAANGKVLKSQLLTSLAPAGTMH